MPDELSTIKNDLLLFSSLTKRENSVLQRILAVFALTELSQYNDNQDKPWRINEKLGKRRNAYAFDRDLHCMIDYINKFGEYSATVIGCGKSGFYRTELNKKDGTTIHFFQKFNPAAKYLKPYLEKNNENENPKYGVFEYNIGKDNCINSVIFYVPTGEDNYNRKIDLTNAFIEVRDKLKQQSVGALLEQLKDRQNNYRIT